MNVIKTIDELNAVKAGAVDFFATDCLPFLTN